MVQFGGLRSPAVQYKKPGLMNGYIQFTLKGGVESRKGYFDAAHDENSVTFYSWAIGDFERIRDAVNNQLSTANAQPPMVSSSPADEVAKLLKLKEAGAITEAEFQQLKKRALGL